MSYFFVGVPHLATYIFLFFQIEPALGVGVDPGTDFGLLFGRKPSAFR